MNPSPATASLEETHGRPKFPQPPRGAEPAPSERLRAHEWLAQAIGPASPVAAGSGRPRGAQMSRISWLNSSTSSKLR